MSKLYIVPTPIGNLDDITLRAVKVLGMVDIILAEDTRNTSFLLSKLGIDKKPISHHMHNEHKTVAGWAARIAAGESLALVSDAGTPAISDPGFLLVRECLRNGVEVECLPGPTAFVPALVNSGLPCDRFVFEGFLPPKKGRQTKFKELAIEERTIVLYESPHKLIKTLGEMVEYFGADRQACVSRELTKMFEENRRGTVAELFTHYTSHPPKGEIVIVIEGAKELKTKREKRKEQDDEED
ncbi:MAG: 16S rRNA (cytidine(1402)-2'-O)-methyltransferase [Sphingobacteriales bacterium JAD_PAG50586_3]|nr:MAG: 16S rRNA (cytidine(1402)-2'-O)-methyltransferase [Sphingobacteriales bacterium JAD_PAG50586_3]